MILASDAVPPDWALRCGGGPLTIGNDVATTDKKSSNPSSITVTEKLNGLYWERLVVRFKSQDPEVTMAILESIYAARPAAEWWCMNIDASSEKYHAKNVQKRFRGRLRVNLIVNSETTVFEGEKFTFKTLLGDLYVSAFEDGIIVLPPEEFILSDHRLVKKQSGGYVTEVDDEGNHGDTFDSGKLSYWGHRRPGGRTRAKALAVGSSGSKGKDRPGIIGSIARQFGFRGGRRISS
jgi:hypothetical protein